MAVVEEHGWWWEEGAVAKRAERGGFGRTGSGGVIYNNKKMDMGNF